MKEVGLAVSQGASDIDKVGIVLAVRKDGKVIRRGIGIPPWKDVVTELNKKT
jgi:hypothetical protein